MTRRMAIVLVMILGVLVICALGTGCAEPYTTDARVTAKEYRPACTWMYPQQVGKIQIWVPVNEPEHWYLRVAWIHQGKPALQAICVDQGTYSRAVVGSLVQIQVGILNVNLVHSEF